LSEKDISTLYIHVVVSVEAHTTLTVQVAVLSFFASFTFCHILKYFILSEVTSNFITFLEEFDIEKLSVADETELQTSMFFLVIIQSKGAFISALFNCCSYPAAGSVGLSPLIIKEDSFAIN
jgi:hypothetical protein